MYRSEEARAAIADLYDRARRALPMATDSRRVPTRFGDTHVLMAGPEDAAPIVVFGGGNVVGPLTLGWFSPLAERFRLVAPDTIGQPGLSADRRVSGSDDSLGLWAIDVLDQLGLDQAAAIGVSYGAGVLLRVAEIAPNRLTRAAVVVPSGITGSPRGCHASAGGRLCRLPDPSVPLPCGFGGLVPGARTGRPADGRVHRTVVWRHQARDRHAAHCTTREPRSVREPSARDRRRARSSFSAEANPSCRPGPIPQPGLRNRPSGIRAHSLAGRGGSAICASRRLLLFRRRSPHGGVALADTRRRYASGTASHRTWAVR